MRLTKGVGSPEQGAGCWMVLNNVYARGEWTDAALPGCVPPTIRELAIVANDLLPDGLREEVIGQDPLILLTADPSEEAEQERAWQCAEWAVRRYALPHESTREWATELLATPRGERSSRPVPVAAAVAAGAQAMAAAEAEATAANEGRALYDLTIAMCRVGTPRNVQVEPGRYARARARVCGERIEA